MPRHLNNNLRSGFRSAVHKERSRRFGILMVGVFIAILAIIAVGFYARDIVSLIGTPMLRVSSALHDYDVLIAPRQMLIERIRSLERDNQTLKAQAQQTTALVIENNALRTLLDARDTNEVFARVASVIVRPPQTPFGLLIVDVGRRDGVRLGDIVRIVGREYLGEIIALEETSAKARLFSEPDSELIVLVGNTQTSLTAHGLAGSWRIEVPHTFIAAVGDAIMMASSTRGILGYITHIDERSGESFKYLYAAPSINVQELSWVDIIRYE